ncbi:regulator of RpoD, Rsd/AlgQ [Psychromonas ingrahamii 37]|uniref:Regulator of RpoD, Rsd/AlgQ n=1 Tax=Psychromonas ingrahamii (strain DSM 17664 / CCUG 51855 / 37) TaxID=357804 RepID=A1SZJ6_PSYIN|nr:Rsd/AlgQ family anti-sigma factor [Psychromonas ingrahamii]ABM04911.1 regulator of RpoD, Rsd/AlgQ [Psychromonas ingrahamii 37]
MLTKLERAKEEWGGRLSVIDNWLEERQTLVVVYCKLAGLPPYQETNHSLPAQEKITHFCQLLLDYASTGHFEIYEQIITQCKLDGENNLKIAQELYSRITTTTDAALSFNDKYAESANEQALVDFDRDLSNLGQLMEERFEREDQLLEVVHLHHTLA